MRITKLKDSLRNIWKQRVSFLSIILIATLGITTFLGIDYTTAGFRESAMVSYRENNFRDIEILSTLLFSREDLDDLKSVEGVTDAEAVLMTRAKIRKGTESRNIQVLSETERINRLIYRSGRKPQGKNECAIEEHIAESLGIAVGDKVLMTDAQGKAPEYLLSTEYTVTAIVVHQDHYNKVVPVDPYVFVNAEAFDAEALDGDFMIAELVVDKPADADLFSNSYQQGVRKIQDRIDAIAPKATARRNTVFQEKLDKGLEKLVEAFDTIEDAKESVRNKIREAYEKLFTSEAIRGLVHWAGRRTFNPDDPNAGVPFLDITDVISIDLTLPLDTFILDLIHSDKVPDQLLAAVYSLAFKEEPPKVQDGNEYDYAAVRAALEDAAKPHLEKYKQFTDGLAQWKDAVRKYEKARNMEPCRWLPFDVTGNASFSQLMAGSSNFSDLKGTFSLMFILVGALVIFATIGKMIDEQRYQVGTMKAVGFFTREIFTKYLWFGVLGTLIGTLLGILAAYIGVQPFMLQGFDKYYRIPINHMAFPVPVTLLTIAAAVLLAVIAIWLACRRLLKEPAVRLMVPKVPSARNKAQKKRAVLSLYTRLILLNMRTDLKRVIVTIVSVAGCCALVVIGITLRNGLFKCVDLQYKQIIRYDLCVKFDPEASDTVQKDIDSSLRARGTEFTPVYNTNVTYRAGSVQVSELFCGDLKEIYDYYLLDDWKTGKPLFQVQDGLVVQRKIAEKLGLNVGSEFEISVGGTKTANVRVAAVFENYIGRAMMMSREYYEKVYGEAPVPNAFLVRQNGADAQALENSLKGITGFETLNRADTDRSIVENSTSMINGLVLLFIFIAALMAGVVQMNLTNMYILQKKRELIIMRVNGFTVKEVIGYVLRETVLTTIAGIVLGIALGSVVSYSILRTMEQTFIQFFRGVCVPAWLIGAGLTVVFTVIVNFIALRKTKDLKLTDAA